MSRIGTVQVQKVLVEMPVQDIERAKQFYQDTFGLEVSWYMSGVDFCELFLPGKLTTLGLAVTRGGDAAAQQRPLLSFEVGPADLEALRASLQGTGIETTEITDRPSEISYFDIKDSEGNRVRILGDARVEM